MSSRSRVPSAPSWAWTLLVHLSPMWRALGAHRTPIKLDDLGIHFHSHPSQGIGHLPPPRSRPELPTHLVEVSGKDQQKFKQMPVPPSKLRGRAVDQMVGLRPESRAKTPTQTGSHGIVESFVLMTEPPHSEQEMMTEEEWQAAMMCDPRLDVDPEDQMAPLLAEGQNC